MIWRKPDLVFLCVICLVGAQTGCGGSSSSSVAPPTLWTINISQSGTFTPNGTGQYSITPTNSSSSATSGTVTVADSLPSGGVLTATNLAGTGWTCTLSTTSCTRSDALAAGASYPAITLTVSVSASASGTVTDQATLSGGGPANATASIQTQISPSTPWTINISQSGMFTPNGTGQYSVTVTNSTSFTTSGTVTMTDSLPSGGVLTATNLAGTGWTCTLSTTSCTRSDALAAGASYPAITLTVSVSASASGTVTDQATVSGGGSANATASIQTEIAPSTPWTINISQSGSFAANGTGQYSVTVTNSTSYTTSGTVTVTDSLPSGGVFTATNLAGTGWTCTLSTTSCTRSDALAVGASFPAITLTVSVSASASGTVTDQATVSGGGPADATASIQTQISRIQHVVVIVQENRTPDNLFHDPVLMNRTPCPGACADIANVGLSTNGPVTLTPVPLVTNYDLSHGHDTFLNACDWNGTACAMDGENLVGCSPPANCPANPQYQYVQASDIQPYFTMAETYAFGDRMFQTNQGNSFPAHQYILSGSSAVCTPGGSCPSGTTNTVDVVGDPTGNQRANGSPGAGCLAPPGASVALLDTSQPFPNSNLTSLNGQECFEHPTLTDLLETANLSWNYYAMADGSIWTAPDAIQHICEPSGPQDQLVCSGTDWNDHVVLEGTGAQILTDIQNCQLANVAWVIPDGAASDHMQINTGLGPSWVASIVNAIGTNPACPGSNEIYWNDTAIIVTWDDWGGWYDHVAPPIRNTNPPLNSNEYGFRVPLIVISPYAKAATVSHQQNDFGSILKFIEEMFSLPTTIGQSVGLEYADSYALGDLSDFFDFSQTPLKFAVIPAAHDPKFFINRKEKPTPPDND